MCYNVLRNTDAELLQEVCKDVQIESTLNRLEGENIDGCKTSCSCHLC